MVNPKVRTTGMGICGLTCRSNQGSMSTRYTESSSRAPFTYCRGCRPDSREDCCSSVSHCSLWNSTCWEQLAGSIDEDHLTVRDTADGWGDTGGRSEEDLRVEKYSISGAPVESPNKEVPKLRSPIR